MKSRAESKRKALHLITPLHNRPPSLPPSVDHVFNIDTGAIVGVQDTASGTRIIIDGYDVHIVAGDYRVMDKDAFLHLFECAKCLLSTNS